MWLHSVESLNLSWKSLVKDSWKNAFFHHENFEFPLGLGSEAEKVSIWNLKKEHSNTHTRERGFLPAKAGDMNPGRTSLQVSHFLLVRNVYLNKCHSQKKKKHFNGHFVRRCTVFLRAFSSSLQTTTTTVMAAKCRIRYWLEALQETLRNIQSNWFLAPNAARKTEKQLLIGLQQ